MGVASMPPPVSSGGRAADNACARVVVPSAWRGFAYPACGGGLVVADGGGRSSWGVAGFVIAAAHGVARTSWRQSSRSRRVVHLVVVKSCRRPARGGARCRRWAGACVGVHRPRVVVDAWRRRCPSATCMWGCPRCLACMRAGVSSGRRLLCCRILSARGPVGRPPGALGLRLLRSSCRAVGVGVTGPFQRVVARGGCDG